MNIAQDKKDELIQELIAIVNEKKATIAKIQKPNWQTNCVLVIEDKTTNIRTINSVDKAVDLFRVILNASKTHTEACETLEVANTTFKFGGYTLEQWTNDFKNITGNINIKTIIADLEEDEKALDSLVSKEKREELQLLALQKKLKG